MNRIAASLFGASGLGVAAIMAVAVTNLRAPAQADQPSATPAWDDFIFHLKNSDRARAWLAESGGGSWGAQEENSRINRYFLFDAAIDSLWYIPGQHVYSGGGASHDGIYRYQNGVTEWYTCTGIPRADHHEILPMAPFVAELWAEARSGFENSEVVHDGMGNVFIKFPFAWASSISVAVYFAASDLTEVNIEGFGRDISLYIREIQWEKDTPSFLSSTDEAGVCSYSTAAGFAELNQWSPETEPEL